MIVETVKLNAVAVAYEMLSDLGKKINRRQSFNIMSYTASNQDFYDVGKAISDFLAYPSKEILKNYTSSLEEA